MDVHICAHVPSGNATVHIHTWTIHTGKWKKKERSSSAAYLSQGQLGLLEALSPKSVE